MVKKSPSWGDSIHTRMSSAIGASNVAIRSERSIGHSGDFPKLPAAWTCGRRRRTSGLMRALQSYRPDHAPTRDGSAIDSGKAPEAGLLIMNADDWGRDPRTTGKILDCALRGAVSSVSAMDFMEDSERD